jgi:hypothetical protein
MGNETPCRGSSPLNLPLKGVSPHFFGVRSDDVQTMSELTYNGHPFQPGKWYKLRDLRRVAVDIVHARQATRRCPR